MERFESPQGTIHRVPTRRVRFVAFGDTPLIGAGSNTAPTRIVPGSLGSWDEHEHEATG